MKRVILGIIIIGVVVGAGIGLADYFSGSTPTPTPVTQQTAPTPKVVKEQPEVSQPTSDTTQQLNPVISSIYDQLKAKGYLFVNITPKQLATFQGQPNTGMTPEQLNSQLLNGFNGKLLSAGDLENSQYIVDATMNGNPVKVVNMIDPYLLQTYSGNAFVCVVSNGKLVPLSEVQQAINNGQFNVQESYPYKYFFTQDNINDLANNNGKFLYGTFIS